MYEWLRWEATIREVPIKMYLTAERALNKDETGVRLYWKAGYHELQLWERQAKVIEDSRGKVISIVVNDNSTNNQPVVGWIRDDEINQKVEWVPTAYHTLTKEDDWLSLISKYDVTSDMIRIWNPWIPIAVGPGILHPGRTLIVDVGLPKYSENIFKLEDLINNRFNNANNPEYLSVLIQGRPNTRYKIETNIPRHPGTNKFEVYAGQPALLILDSNGASLGQPLSVTADDNGMIELAFADSELSSTNVGFEQVLNNQYWVSVKVNTDPVPIPPLGVVTIYGKQYRLEEGPNIFDDLVLSPGNNEIEIEGSGKLKVSFSYQTEVMG